MDEFIEKLKKMRGKEESTENMPKLKRPLIKKNQNIETIKERPTVQRETAALKKRKPAVEQKELKEQQPVVSKNSKKRRPTDIERKTPPKRKRKRKLTKQEIEFRKKKKQKEQIIEIIKFVVPVIIMATIVFIFIFNTSPHIVDGDSMNPTLQSGDKVIAKRTKTPNRYEIITFDPPVDSNFQYVKRVIGMPGDAIWIEGSDLFINQTEGVPEGVVLNAANELPDGTIKVSISPETVVQLSKFDKIPDEFYFVLGDNRNNSSDSREFGLVSKFSIEGVVTFRYKPLSSIGWVR
ncbi:signal peptidase I [Enterococcus sp. BWT-B8]|uniref:signal peptidase I n=1 Tax=Enterococcus sp. BWT-B8 TaxID=2885157 RepID=UPI001E32DE85|nr:signal peptidase I [Enterococcus sp. BWT-B8]MCB5952111.1 signal peptidase I [Enterococcus sp. BWT-B8]